MRLATFRGPDGQPRVGAVNGDAGNETIVDVSGGRSGRPARPAPGRTGDARRSPGGRRRRRRPAARLGRAARADPPPGQAARGGRQLPGPHRGGWGTARRQDEDRAEAVHQAVVLDHRAGRGRRPADRLERARLGARARDRHRQGRPRHPARAAPATTSPATRSSTTSRPARCSGASRAASRAASTTSSTG